MKSLNLKKILSCLLAVVTVLASIPFIAPPTNVSAATTEETETTEKTGKTGDCTWTLNGTVLTISGNGEMDDYTSSSSRPWGTSITKVIIEDGVERIGDYSFYNCSELTDINLSACSSLISIGRDAFYGTSYYKTGRNWSNKVLHIGTALIKAESTISGNYTVREGTTIIADYAFNNCTGLTGIDFFGYADHTSIGKYAFCKCTNLASIDLSNCRITSISSSAFTDTAYYKNSSNWENNVL